MIDMLKTNQPTHAHMKNLWQRGLLYLFSETTTVLFIILGRSHDIVVNALCCVIIVSEFELQPCYYIHVQINSSEKDMISLILPVMGLNSITAVLLQG